MLCLWCDSEGKKDDNYVLGFQRALTVYKEIQKYGPEIADHAVQLLLAPNGDAEQELLDGRLAALRMCSSE